MRKKTSRFVFVLSHTYALILFLFFFNFQASLLIATTPQELMDAKDIHSGAVEAAASSNSAAPPVLPFSPSKVLAKCIVQLELVGVVDKVVQKHWNKFTGEQVEKWLNMLSNVYEFARTFQDEKGLRHWLWKGGFMLKVKMKNDRPPSLLSQESASISSFVHIVFHLHDENSKEDDYSGARRKVTEPRMVEICTQVLNKYIHIDRNLAEVSRKGGRAGLEEMREKQMFLPIVVNILSEFQRGDDSFLRNHLTWLWPLMTRLISADSIEIRAALSSLMENAMTNVVEAGVKALQ